MILNRITKYFLVVILMVSGVGKIINPSATISVLLAIPIFPNIFIIPIISLLPLVEIIIGLALIINHNSFVTTVACAGLFLFFFLLSIYGVAIGLQNDCGCFGSFIESRFGWKMIVRNFIFLLMSMSVFFTNSIQNRKSSIFIRSLK